MPLSYSKWDNIELSDDEDNFHPNIDNNLMIRLQREKRQQREKEEAEKREKLVSDGSEEAKEELSRMEAQKKLHVGNICHDKFSSKHEKGSSSASAAPKAPKDDKVKVINLALQSKPEDGSTQWSARSLAAATGISKTTVHRWLQTFSVQPHRQKSHRCAEACGYKLSTDPFFVEKVRDIVGLYLNPPENAVVLCVDEKTQIQALDRTQPLLPMGLG